MRFLELSESVFKLFSENIADLADSFEAVLQSFVRVGSAVLSALDAHIADGLRRVRHGVSAELDSFVFNDLVSKQVAQRVVFVVEAEGRILEIAFNLQSFVVLNWGGRDLWGLHFNVCHFDYKFNNKW